jgi:hypothetical protein
MIMAFGGLIVTTAGIDLTPWSYVENLVTGTSIVYNQVKPKIDRLNTKLNLCLFLRTDTGYLSRT